MFFGIDRAIDMVETKIDYLRKAWVIPFPKIPFRQNPTKISKTSLGFFKIYQNQQILVHFPPKFTIVGSKCFFKLTEQ